MSGQRIALVENNGEISSIVYPSQSGMFEEGKTYGSTTARFLVTSASDTTVLASWWWDNTWRLDKPARPSNNHVWQNGEWSIDSEALWTLVRSTRGDLLTQSDWTQVIDAPLTESKKLEWATYRTALRNVPTSNASALSPEDISWPTAPN
jgi:hypothetical protein